MPALLYGVSRTPSSGLIAALESSRYRRASPRAYLNKVDLSHFNPRALWTQKQKLRFVQSRIGLLAQRNDISWSQGKPRLQALLARYIQTVDSVLRRNDSITVPSGQAQYEANDVEDAVANLYTDDVLAYLQSKGYGAEDLMSWTWILTAPSAERAASRLVALSSWYRSSREPSKTVPTFVFLFLLRQPRLLSVRALKLLLVHGWDRLLGRQSQQFISSSTAELDDAVKQGLWSAKRWNQPVTATDTTGKMGETTAMIMIVRLLRHARLLWPQAIVNIAAMISSHIDGLNSAHRSSPHAALSERSSARLTFIYNRALSLLSVPSALQPFQSVAYYQRAQFNLLRRMTEFEPALAINREGYRAIIRVQLAHRKTPREREWANMKAKSWPPWKEEKLGIDVDKGIENGISRASESLTRLREAGYSNHAWEKVATVLAGWDTDRSPTIQTRALLRRPSTVRKLSSPSPKAQGSTPPDDSGPEVWSARIRATRTVEEAWACFLTHNDQHMPAMSVYYAMFEKLVFHSKIRRQQSSSQNEQSTQAKEVEDVLPGDSKEVYMAPVSPQEAIYVRSPPPSIEELFNRMVTDGIQPAGRCLAFLVSHAASLSDGFKFLQSSALSPGIIKALTSRLDVAESYSGDLRSLPDYIFAAFIRLLCRFGTTSPVDRQHHTSGISRGNGRLQNLNSEQRFLRISPLLHAIQLMNLRKPQYRPPWNALLSALSKSGTILGTHHHSRSIALQGISAWAATLEVERQMRAAGLDLDSQGFQILCIGLEKAVVESRRAALQRHAAPVPPASRSDIEAFGDPVASQASPVPTDGAAEALGEGSRVVKATFAKLVGLDEFLTERQSCINHLRLDSLKENELVEPGALLPRLLTVPGPSALHAYVRALGFMQDYDALLFTLRWMKDYAPELHAAADEARNGRRLLRRTLIAFRVFLERSWLLLDKLEGDDNTEERTNGAPEPVIQQVYEIMEGTDQWGGWPTDEEVEAYCRKGRFY